MRLRNDPSSVLFTIAAMTVAVPFVADCRWAVCQEQERADNQQETGRPDAAERTAPNGGESNGEVPQNARYDDQDHGTPALGVVVGPCPGDAVCVHEVIEGGPAAESGIEAGDYILAVNGHQVTSPRQLKEALQAANENKAVKVKIWRDRQELEKELVLATEAKDLPAGHRAWLGVMLAPAEPGVRIEDVVAGSAAAEAGLRRGDQIVTLNNRAVESIEWFVESVAEYGPGSELQLGLRRGDREQSVAVQLGDVRHAPLRYLREVYGSRSNEGDFSGFGGADHVDLRLIETTLDEMRQQIRELAEQVRELRGESTSTRNPQPGNQPSAQGDEESPTRNIDSRRTRPENRPATETDVPRSNDSSSRDRLDLGPVGRLRSLISPSVNALLLQQVVASPVLVGNDVRSNDYQVVRRPYRYSRGPRDYWQYPGPRYYSPYVQPGYSYYRYGGRPYYYGGQYGYGPRGGVRFGPNFGIYWY